MNHNIASLVARLLSLDDSPAKPAAAEPKLPRVLVRKVALAQGRVSLFDQTNPKRERAHVENIALEVQDVSTLPGRDGGYAISAKLPGEGSVAWRGKISLAPIASEGEFEVKALRLARVAPFSPIELRLEQPAGVLDLGLRYRVSYSGGQFPHQRRQHVARGDRHRAAPHGGRRSDPATRGSEAAGRQL